MYKGRTFISVQTYSFKCFSSQTCNVNKVSRLSYKRPNCGKRENTHSQVSVSAKDGGITSFLRVQVGEISRGKEIYFLLKLYI